MFLPQASARSTDGLAVAKSSSEPSSDGPSSALSRHGTWRPMHAYRTGSGGSSAEKSAGETEGGKRLRKKHPLDLAEVSKSDGDP